MRAEAAYNTHKLSRRSGSRTGMMNDLQLLFVVGTGKVIELTRRVSHLEARIGT